jgi:hypothetical protein
MLDQYACRQQAREAMRSAGHAIDPDLAEHYRTLAAAYLALARFLERSARYRRPDKEAEPTARPATH